MSLTFAHIIGIAVTFTVIIGMGVYSGRKVKSASDFCFGGGKTGSAVVTGIIVGTLVGGSSTIGTAQLAYTNGLSAWWFTLGGGISCLILAVWYVKPLRRSRSFTLLGIISGEYGGKAGMLGSVMCSLGIFINIISQIISAMAILAAVFGGLSPFTAALVSATLVAVYVIFGGVWAAGIVGFVKLILLYAACIAAGVIALSLSGGFGSLYGTLDHSVYFNLFSRGIGIDGGAGISLILGVLSTQIYAQAVMSAKSDRAARRGALISAFLIPPIGAGGILVGLYMRLSCPGIDSKLVFPRFIIDHLPAVLGGVVIATLLIAVIGTAAGLVLSISTIINKDIAFKLTKRLDDPKKELVFFRICILIILALACVLSAGALGETILGFGFMSMALRGAVVFVPLFCALRLPGRIDRRFIIAAITAGPLSILLGNIFAIGFDPLFIGMGIVVLICVIGGIAGQKKVRGA